MPIDVNGNIISGTSFNTTGDILNEPSVVTDDLVLWYDAGNLASYLDSYDYYDCGYGCQYYASDPGCTACNTQIKDMSGYANDGTFAGNAGVSYDDTGGYVLFSNSGDWIDTNTNNIITGTNPFTIECFYTLSSGNYGELFGNYGSSYTSGYVWFATAGLYINGSCYIPNYSTVTQGTHHNVATRDVSGNCVIYFDGEVANTASLTASVPVGLNFRLGADVNGGGEPLNGRIYICRVYNKVLTNNEVIQNFNNGRSRFGI
jgi:hypothetical protein